MSQPVISEQDREALLELILVGQLKLKIEYGRWAIEFDLASAGAEGRAEVDVQRANSGVYNEGMRRLGILANSIVRIGSLDMTQMPFASRFDELAKMQPPMRDFLWEAYNRLRGAQISKFDREMAQSKKSLDSQIFAITGDSSSKEE